MVNGYEPKNSDIKLNFWTSTKLGALEILMNWCL